MQRTWVFVVCVVVAGVAGYLAGQAGWARIDGRTHSGTRWQRSPKRTIGMPLDEYERLRERVGRLDAAEAENLRLKEELEQLRPPPADAEPPKGTRLPDGRLVGGARFPASFVRLATGFLDSILVQFLAEAELTPEQERRIREEVSRRAPQFTDITADFVNGDIDGDTTYERLESAAEDARKVVRGMLDDPQFAVFQRFERTTKDIMRHQITHNELQTLKSELDLDADQLTRVEKIVEERYRRVGENTTVVMPNVLLKPIRADQDQPIYDETAKAIRQLLRPDQAAAFDRVEAKAPKLPFDYRNMLVPK